MGHVSPGPPFYPGQSNFSSPVGDHGLSPNRPSHYRRGLSAGPHTPHTVLVCLLARHLLEHRFPGLNVPPRVHLTPTMHREPLCPFRALPLRGWPLPPPRKAFPFPHRSYGLMRQTNSLPLTSASASLVGLCRLLPAPAGNRPPGRPEEFHHQSPTEPYVNLSAHTARVSHSLGASRHQADKEREKLLPDLWLATTPFALTHPLRSILITRTSSLLRDDPPPPCASILSPFVGPPLIGFSLAIT